MTHRRSVCGWLLGVFIIAVVGIVVVPTQTSGAMDRDEKVTRKGEVTQNDLNFQLNVVLHELDDMKQQLNLLLRQDPPRTRITVWGIGNTERSRSVFGGDQECRPRAAAKIDTGISSGGGGAVIDGFIHCTDVIGTSQSVDPGPPLGDFDSSPAVQTDGKPDCSWRYTVGAAPASSWRVDCFFY